MLKLVFQVEFYHYESKRLWHINTWYNNFCANKNGTKECIERIHFGITRALQAKKVDSGKNWDKDKTHTHTQRKSESAIALLLHWHFFFAVFQLNYCDINGRISIHSAEWLCTWRAIKPVFMPTQTHFALQWNGRRCWHFWSAR